MKYTTNGNITTFTVYEVSDPISESGVAVNKICGFAGFVVSTDGSNDVTLNLFDSVLSANGKHLIPLDSKISGTVLLWSFSYDPPIKCTSGVYAEITCSGTCSLQVIYDV